MIFSDLASPAEASSQTKNLAKGFAQAGNRYPLFGIMRWRQLRLLPDGPGGYRRGRPAMNPTEYAGHIGTPFPAQE
jgi:hypothetical protein